MGSVHDGEILSAFAAQAGSFNAAEVANADEILEAIVALADPRPDQHWLETACGPGIVARRLARHVHSVEGLDMTPAMIDLARGEAAAAGLDNVAFDIGDATRIERPDDSYDGAVTRFSVHHMPVPERMFAEMSRVVRPGGRIVVVDHLADRDPDALIWSQQIERLRDPSHWTSLTREGFHTLGERAGLSLADEKTIAYRLDFEDWLERGGADPTSCALVEEALLGNSGGAECFVVEGPVGERALTLQVYFAAWTNP